MCTKAIAWPRTACSAPSSAFSILGFRKRLAGRRKRPALQAAAEVLDRLGIADLRERRPSQVSGGQNQRVAVARALVHRPAVVFADEPTGALDSANAGTVLDEFLELARSQGTAVLLVTHDASVAARADTRYTMTDGVLAPEVPVR